MSRGRSASGRTQTSPASNVKALRSSPTALSSVHVHLPSPHSLLHHHKPSTPQTTRSPSKWHHVKRNQQPQRPNDKHLFNGSTPYKTPTGFSSRRQTHHAARYYHSWNKLLRFTLLYTTASYRRMIAFICTFFSRIYRVTHAKETLPNGRYLSHSTKLTLASHPKSRMDQGVGQATINRLRPTPFRLP